MFESPRARRRNPFSSRRFHVSRVRRRVRAGRPLGAIRLIGPLLAITLETGTLNVPIGSGFEYG